MAKHKKQTKRKSFFRRYFTLILPIFNKRHNFIFIKEFFDASRSIQNVKFTKGERDPALTSAIVLAWVIGIIFIFSATMYEGYTGTPEWFKQLLFGCFGFLLYFGLSRVREEYWVKHVDKLFAWSLLTLFLVLFAEPVNGATRWIAIGPITIQPAEFFRIFAIMLFALALSKKAKTGKNIFAIFLSYEVLPVIMAIFTGWYLIYKQPDFELLIPLTMFAIILSAEYLKPVMRQLWISVGLMVTGCIALLAVLPTILMGYQSDRIVSWLDPWSYALTSAYQVINAQIAFVKGGLTGVGIGQGTQKTGYVPYPQSDFILTTIGEETGFVGVLLVIGLLLFIVYLLFKNARELESPFGRLFLMGTGYYMLICIIINIGGVTGFIPMTGLPMPFISYGSSALWANLIFMGICQSFIVSDQRRKNESEFKNEKTATNRR